MQRNLIILLTFGLLLNSCATGKLRDADLVFVKSSDGAFSEAISSATKSYAKECNFDHVGIIIKDNDMLRVIEAKPIVGVIIRSLDEFIDENGASNLVFMRMKGLRNAHEIVSRACSFAGREYDYAFMPNDIQIYCSELVQLSYVDRKGKPLFETIPMNFRNADGTMPEFWEMQYARLGIPIPEGVPGTNPNQIASDKRLIVIPNPSY